MSCGPHVPHHRWTGDEGVRPLTFQLMKQGVEIKESIVIHLTHILCPATEGIGPKKAGEGLVREAAVSFRVRDLSSDYCSNWT